MHLVYLYEKLALALFSSCTEIGTAAILCTSPTAYLAISWRSFGWYWVWIHSREEFSHTLPENKFVATYPHKVLNSPRYLLMLYFNCMSQPANNKSLLNLQWGFGGRDWKILLIILKMVCLFWVNEFYPFACIRDPSKPICWQPFLCSLSNLCSDCCIPSQQNTVLAGALGSTCLH